MKDSIIKIEIICDNSTTTINKNDSYILANIIDGEMFAVSISAANFNLTSVLLAIILKQYYDTIIDDLDKIDEKLKENIIVQCNDIVDALTGWSVRDVPN